MEVYIDDTLMKFGIVETHINHLMQSYKVLKKYNMKLNPSKCSFEVSSRSFLGFLVTQSRIKANLN